MVLKFALKPIHIQVFVLLVLLLIVNIGFSQTKGTISGKIIDKKTGEELIGVAVGIKGTSMGSQTDLEGKYQISAAPGVYTLAFVYIGYNTVEMANVEVKPDEVNYINLSLEESVNQLEEVVIQAESVKESASFVLLERKNAAQVSDGISADLIRKTPDRTTSDVLKRVTGASIQDGKFAIIRGMSDRYNAGYLNGAPLPSTESDRKAFSFDVIPANLVDNIQIIKAGTPDLIGDFGGGIIQINTKNIPEVASHQVTIGAQYNTLTTFKDFSSFKGSNTDFLGLTGKERSLPSFATSMKENQATVAEIKDGSKLFNNDWKVSTNKALPNFRFSYSGGLPFKLFGKDFGVLGAISYNNNRRIIPGTLKTYTFDNGYPDVAYEETRYEQNNSLGGLLNLSCKLSPNHVVSFRNFINVNTFYNTLLRSGIENQATAPQIRTQVGQYTDYGYIYSGQLGGDHSIGSNFMKVKWILNSGFINRQQPDNRTAIYITTDEVDDDGNAFKNNLLLPGDLPNRGTGRFFSSLDEDIKSGTLNLSKQVDIGTVKNEIKIGGFYQVRVRSFRSRFYSVVRNSNPAFNTLDAEVDLGPDDVNSGNRFYSDITVENRDSYRAKSNLGAAYLMFDNKFFNRLRAVWGVRYEQYYQEIVSSPTPFDLRQIGTTTGVWLPSVNLTYSLTEKTNIRAAGYMTVNRPEFRELASFPYFNQQINAEVRGNDLLAMARIYNAEVRFEYFPTGGQVLSAGVFYKFIENPIEFYLDVTQPTIRTFSYQNQKSAVNYGLEFEARKSLDFIGKSFAPAVFNNLVVYGNLALITSKIQFNPGSGAYENRPMQGQSPFVINAGLQYENQAIGLSASFAYNYVGRRIYSVGSSFQAFGFDVWENPRHILDFQIGKTIKNLDIKLTIGDLLAQNLIFYQDVNSNGKLDAENDFLMYNYKMGSTITLGLGYRF